MTPERAEKLSCKKLWLDSAPECSVVLLRHACLQVSQIHRESDGEVAATGSGMDQQNQQAPGAVLGESMTATSVETMKSVVKMRPIQVFLVDKFENSQGPMSNSLENCMVN
jgi:hypothetical protein